MDVKNIIGYLHGFDMNKEEIFKMASEAGFSINEMHCSPPIISFIGYEEHMEAFAKLVAEKEREAILDLVDGYAKNNTDLVEAIRARGQR
jgi:hypothetical protein